MDRDQDLLFSLQNRLMLEFLGQDLSTLSM